MENLAEASLVDGVEVLGVATLSQLHSWLGGGTGLAERMVSAQPEGDVYADLADVVGQDQARYAVEVSAAGAHHLAGRHVDRRQQQRVQGVGEARLAQALFEQLPQRTARILGAEHRAAQVDQACDPSAGQRA